MTTSSFSIMLLSGSIGPKISVIEFGQNFLLYSFSWPKCLWPKRPGQNVLAKTSVAKTSYIQIFKAQLDQDVNSNFSFSNSLFYLTKDKLHHDTHLLSVL